MMLGPHCKIADYAGYIFAFAFLTTMSLVALLLYSMSSQLSPFWFYSLIVCSAIYAYSYLRIGLSYPGFAEPARARPANPAVPYCSVCNVVGARGIYHCPDCNVCI